MRHRRYRQQRQSSPVGRVVFRSNNNANAVGGVSYAYAYYGSSGTGASIGSRLNNLMKYIRDVPDGFPFETTIKAETFGKGKTKYIFS